MITGHGDDSYRYNVQLKADFSSNVWYEGPPPALIKHLQAHLKYIHHYPEPAAETLTQEIASKNDCDPGQVIVTNGSTEAFYLIAQAFPKGSSTILTPSFAEYADACLLHGHTLKYTRNSIEWANDISDTDILWLGNPNNPDGKIYPSRDIRNLLKNNRDTLVVIDEAYSTLCYQYEPLTPLLKEFENLVIVRSFTKTFAIPGIRLGYMLGSVKYINTIRKYLIPWSVNTIALEAGRLILDREETFRPDPDRLKREQEAFQQSLQTVEKMKVIPSSCNFSLVQLKMGNSAEMKEYLLRNHGILIRDAANFKGLNEQYIRVALQNNRDNQLLIDGIKQYFSQWK